MRHRIETRQEKNRQTLYPRPVQVFANEVVQVAVWLLFDEHYVAYTFSMHLVQLRPESTVTLLNAAMMPKMAEALTEAHEWVRAEQDNPESLAVRLRQSLALPGEDEHVC